MAFRYHKVESELVCKASEFDGARKPTGKKCGHKWIPRKDAASIRVCPKCKSSNWRGDRIVKRKPAAC